MPAYEIVGMDIPLTAGEDLANNQFYIVYVPKGDDNEVKACDNSEVPVGVLQNDPDEGKAANVRVAGVTKCVAGATILSGYEIMSGSTGKAEKHTSTNYRIGIALTGAGDGERFTLLLSPANL